MSQEDVLLRSACAVVAILFMSIVSSAAAEQPDLIFRKSTVFKWLTPNDKLATYGLDDPEVEGVACHFTVPERGGFKGWIGVAEEVSDISLACRQVGPVKFKTKFEQGEEIPRHKIQIDLETYVYQAKQGSKEVRIDGYDRKRDLLVSEIAKHQAERRVPAYEYRGPRGRRDPWVDPRIPRSLGDGPPPLSIEEQNAIVDELDARRLPLLVERFGLRNDLDDVPRPVELLSKLLP